MQNEPTSNLWRSCAPHYVQLDISMVLCSLVCYGQQCYSYEGTETMAAVKTRLDTADLVPRDQETLRKTQQRPVRISTKASVWASSASQSNIWKHFLSCNNKNMQHPRFQAQHSCIKPHCPLWSGLRKEAYTESQPGLNASAQRLHSMTTRLRE